MDYVFDKITFSKVGSALIREKVFDQYGVFQHYHRRSIEPCFWDGTTWQDTDFSSEIQEVKEALIEHWTIELKQEYQDEVGYPE